MTITAEPNMAEYKLITAIEEKLVPLIEQVINGYGLAGLGIAIVKDGATLLARGFGKRNLETGEPVTADSLFHMASVSKPFVATAVMQLWEDGRLDLDTPVTTYLPYFALKGGHSEQITVRQLMSHRGGVPDTDDYFWHQPDYDDGALERYVRSLAGETMIAAPGEGYAYSNPAFEVLGDVIAKVSGQSFESYIKHHILEPLGMQDSTFVRVEVAPALATTPHFGEPPVVLPGAYPYNRAHAPSSTLHSSAADMARWAIANLAHGTINGRRILRETSYETLWQPLAETGEETWGEQACLGWFLGTYRGHPIVHHSGSDPGYFSDLILVPALQLGLVVMANAYCATAWGVSDAALDLMLGLEPAVPRCPITVPIGSVLQSAGPEAAITEYRRLQTTAAADYDFDEAHFREATLSAVSIHRPQAVLPLLQVWAGLFPESAEAFEALGQAYLISGDPAQARHNLQMALALDPESEAIPRLLQQL